MLFRSDLVVKVVAVGPASAKATLDSIASEARARGLRVGKVTYPNATKKVTDYAGKIAAQHADGIIFIGGTETPSLVRALVRIGLPAHVYFTSAAGSAAAQGDYPRGTLSGAKVLGPDLRTPAAFKKRILGVDSKVTQFDYTTQSYDAAVVVGLAAAEAGDPALLAQHLSSVTMVGQRCSTPSVCLALIARGTDIDYVGVSGPVDISIDGDVVSASYALRTFGGNNKPGTSVRYVRYP